MRSMKHQQGVTGLGWLIILGLIAFFVSIGLKLFPIYVEYFNVKSSLASLEKTSGVSRMSKLEVRSLLMKKLNINDIKNVKKKNIKVNKRSGAVIVNIDYTVTTPLVGPLSLIAEFNESIESAN